MTKKEKAELEKEVVYNTVYLPVRFFKKEAYIHIDDYKEVRGKREKVVEQLLEENKKLTKCNLNLQEWIDNKEKVNKSLREENEKLKSDLSECECSF